MHFLAPRKEPPPTSLSSLAQTSSDCSDSQAKRIVSVPGTNSCNSASPLAPSSLVTLLKPVRLPPGRLRFATSPSCTGHADNEHNWDAGGRSLSRQSTHQPCTGSTPTTNTIGMLAVYWNTRILNEYAGTSARERLQVAYEAAYRNSEALPQPRITEIDMEIDLYPDRRAFRSRGRYTLVNRADVPIETVLVMFGMDRIDQVELQGADVAARQPRFNLVEFRARTPIAPGETRTLTFTTSDTRRGFEEGSDGSPVLYNGTFAHSPYLAPSIGVQREHYLQSDARRRAYGLEPLPGMAARDDKAQRRRNFINADADFIRFSATVSTSADQIALAPGNLEREWSEGGRKFFRYSTDRPILNFWSVVSGRYVVARDQWNGVELAVHHHPKHGRNVPRMLDAMKQALTYYTAQFGPYPHRQLRIAEFPRYAAPLVAAQSFPAMIPLLGGRRLHRQPGRAGFGRLCVAHHGARGRTPVVAASGGRRRRGGRAVPVRIALRVLGADGGRASLRRPQDAPIPQVRARHLFAPARRVRGTSGRSRAPPWTRHTSTTRRARSRSMPSRTRSAKRS